MDKPNTSILLRDLLFADETLEKMATYATGDGGDDPLTLFAAASRAVTAGDDPTAIEALHKVLALPGLESRVYLQAWCCLREKQVVPPPDLANQIQGVVVEVALEDGLDIVAAYSDHSARYYNFAGGGIIWESQEGEINKLIDALLLCGQNIVNVTGTWDLPRPPAPGKGMARVNALTFGGLHFGQAELTVLAADPVGGPAVRAALALMQALIARQQESKARPGIGASLSIT